MRVKIGDQWFEATADKPIMVELTDFDKENIAIMPSDKYKYAEFHDASKPTVSEKYNWMYAPSTPVPRGLSMQDFVDLKREWSSNVYGDQTVEDILEHVESEVVEIRAEPWDLKEWIDLILLGFDGAWRCSRWYPDSPYSHHTGDVVVKCLLDKFEEVTQRNITKYARRELDVADIPKPEPDHVSRRIDSTQVTLIHRRQVKEALASITSDLVYRGTIHDQSKLEEPEKSPLDIVAYLEYTQGPTVYGSEEYKYRTDMLETKHHYAHNRHHPQFHEYGINDMNLMDIVEMVCDWRAACQRDGEKVPSISLSASCDRFMISDQLRFIIQNTLRTFDWPFK